MRSPWAGTSATNRAELTERSDGECSSEKIGFVYHKASGPEHGGASSIVDVGADVERELVHAQGVVIGESAGIAVRRRAHQVLLELEEGETCRAGDRGARAGRDHDAVWRRQINHGDEPPLGKTVIANVWIAGSGTGHGREKYVGVSIERTESPALAEDFDAAIDDDQHLRRADGAHAIRGNIARGIRDLRAKKA